MDIKILTTLEFDKILAMLQVHTVSEMGKQLAEMLQPAFSFLKARKMLDETQEADQVLITLGKNPMDSFPDTRESLKHIHAVLSLSAKELLQISRCLSICRIVKGYLQREGTGPLLKQQAENLPTYKSIEDEINRCVISEEEISDKASAELASIRKRKRIAGEKMREKLNAMVKSTVFQKYLQEPIITMRDNRYVLPVKAEYRSQVPGILHDLSTSGSTLFVEPTIAVELGNELRQLEKAEEEEISRILATLTAKIDPIANDLILGQEILAELDLIFAKARFAKETKSVCPELNEDGKISIKKGRHPLIKADAIVPIDVRVGDDFSMLIITGPNTGGKTVSLKTVGLFSLMAMSGLYVPADYGTKLSVFDKVYADIGDEQSIEQSLSTFSSHMKKIVRILKEADEHSLVLLDELGAGTDPTEGAALAQAILETLYDRKTTVFATTHYSEIKTFAMTHPGIQNASMEFDIEKLCPTYKMRIGIPGRSNAFEISKKLGVNEEIIKKAEHHMKEKDADFESVLSKLEESRQEIEQEKVLIKQELQRTEQLSKQIKSEKQKLESDKSRILEKAREEARELIKDSKGTIEELVDKLRKVETHSTSERERSIQSARDDLRTLETLVEHVKDDKHTLGKPLENIKSGQTVYIGSLGQEAIVLEKENKKGEVIVSIGQMKTKVCSDDLFEVKETKKEKKAASKKVELFQKDRSFLELDIRGKNVDESIIEIERFIDDATISGIKTFTIIHGKGTGALREGIHLFLKKCTHIKEYRIGAYGEGDAGVTVVTIK